MVIPICKLCNDEDAIVVCRMCHDKEIKAAEQRGYERGLNEMKELEKISSGFAAQAIADLENAELKGERRAWEKARDVLCRYYDKEYVEIKGDYQYACFNLPGFGACGPCTFSTCPAMKKDGE